MAEKSLMETLAEYYGPPAQSEPETEHRSGRKDRFSSRAELFDTMKDEFESEYDASNIDHNEFTYRADQVAAALGLGPVEMNDPANRDMFYTAAARAVGAKRKRGDEPAEAIVFGGQPGRERAERDAPRSSEDENTKWLREVTEMQIKHGIK